MKYLLLLVITAAILFVSCKKTNNVSTGVLVYNASWSVTGLTASWNGTPFVINALAPGQSSGFADSPYVQVPAGTNNITVSIGGNTFLDKNIYASAAAGNSFILFDTSVQPVPARLLQLTDDLNLPDTFQLKYRVLNLVPDTSVKVDIWLVNGRTDSLPIVTAGSYAGSTVNAGNLQAFSILSYHGANYTIKVKKAGSQELYTSIGNYPFAIKGIYSIIFSGLPNGNASTGLKLSVLRHPAR